MRDLTSSWPAVPDWQNVALDRGDVIARSVFVSTQHLVSGNLAGFATKAGLPDQGAGAFAQVSGERYGLRVARDRMLVVNAAPEAMDGGWHEDGYAVTDVSALYHVFYFEGDGVDALIGEAMFVDPDAQSPSAATMFAGQQAVVYYHEGLLRVHIERGFAPYLWQWLGERD
jgi:sarcosine oxidase gamma subunit